jgi:type I pantothenate kinase
MDVAAIADALAARRPAEGLYIIGVTGSVASGKSTLAAALADALRLWQGAPTVALIETDGFLFPNAVLAERGLTMRKGFPETYDLSALTLALGQLRRGAATIPIYSHTLYEADPALARTLERPDILIIEGLALGLERTPGETHGALIDTLIYIDAAEQDLEAWYVARFLGLWAAAEHDETSFYRQFRTLDRAGVESLAHAVWAGINLPNLREHIGAVRASADLVVSKGADHEVVGIKRASLGERGN